MTIAYVLRSVHRRYFYAFTDLNRIYSLIADIFDVSTDYLYGVSDCSLPLSKLNEIFCDDMTYSELISIVLGLSEEHQKAFMIILECLRKKQNRTSEWNASFTGSQIVHSGFSCPRWCSFRPAIDAVRNGSQIADRFTITWLSEKQKRTRFQCFHISWKPLKPSPKLCILFFTDKIEIYLYFDLWRGLNLHFWEFKSLHMAKTAQCHLWKSK